MNVIKIKDLSWNYKPDRPVVLKNINLEVKKGEFLGVMGPTGAGKTTLALSLRGLIPSFFDEGVYSGSVEVLDINVSQSDPQLFADRVGNVFQDASSQVLGTTVFADVAFGPCNLGIEKEKVINRADRYINEVKLNDKKWRSPAMLSGGELQRLVVAGVLCMETSILIMDEPAAELDPRGKEDLCDLLDSLRKEKDITVVLIEQDPELISKYSDNVAVLNHGELVLYGTPKEVFSNPSKCISIGINPPELASINYRLSNKFGIRFPEVLLNSGDMFNEIIKNVDTNKLNSRKNNFAENKYIDTSDATNNKPPLISIKNLHHIYKTTSEDVVALSEINLDIFKGEYITIIGSNGAGKTTLTKHINNILQPTSGSVFYKNEDISKKDAHNLIADIGYCFQNPDHQIFSKTVYDELAYGLRNIGTSEEDIEEKVSIVSEKVGLKNVLNENPFNLGKGERQKIAMASTIIMAPKVLVIDEPTTGLDWLESQRILDLINDLHQNGTTIITVTHDMRIVREYATRVIVMDNGKIVFDGKVKELIKRQDIFQVANIDITPSLKLYHALSDYLTINENNNMMQLDYIADAIGNLILEYQ